MLYICVCIYCIHVLHIYVYIYIYLCGRCVFNVEAVIGRYNIYVFLNAV